MNAIGDFVIIKLSSHVLRVCGHLVSFPFVIGGKIAIFLPIELFNGKSMGSKSSITKSSITPYGPIIIMGNLFLIYLLFVS